MKPFAKIRRRHRRAVKKSVQLARWTEWLLIRYAICVSKQFLFS